MITIQWRKNGNKSVTCVVCEGRIEREDFAVRFAIGKSLDHCGIFHSHYSCAEMFMDKEVLARAKEKTLTIEKKEEEKENAGLDSQADA